jgi:hypothetical protein
MALMPEALEDLVKEKVVERRIAEEMLEARQKALAMAEEEQQAVLSAIEFALSVTGDLQSRVKVMLDSAVNHAAEAIGFDRRFEFAFSVSHDKTVVTPTLYKGEYELGDMLSADSGGLSEVLALAIRASFLVLAKRRRFVYLDEDFTGVDDVRLSLTRELLQELSEKLDTQIVLNTHIPQLTELGSTVINLSAVKQAGWEKCEVRAV